MVRGAWSHAGPLFALGCVPDVVRRFDPATSDLVGAGMELNPAVPSAFAAGALGECFFPHASARSRPPEIASSCENARSCLHRVQDTLLKTCKSLLRKGRASREPMLQWLATAVECNANRARSMAPHKLDASDNTMLNLAYVLLRLCEPFIKDAAKTAIACSDDTPPAENLSSAAGSSSVGATKQPPPVIVIASDYAVRCRRYLQKPEHSCSFHTETKFAVESDELDAWVDRRNLARIKAFENAKKQRQQEQEQREGESEQGAAARQDDVDDDDEEDAMDALLGEEEDNDDDDFDAMDALLAKELEAESEAPAPEPAQPAVAKFGFVTECFWMTARALHHGFIPTLAVSDKSRQQSSTFIKLLHALSPISRQLNAMGRAGLSHPLMGKADQMCPLCDIGISTGVLN
jgi:hypothetical protein